MNWSLSSRAVGVLLALALVAAVAGPVAAVDVSKPDVSSSSQVGDSLSATYEFTELYAEYNSWTLSGATEVQNPVWTVTTYDQTGAQIAQKEYTNASFRHAIDAEAGVNRVTVKLTGDTPEPESGNYSYAPPQQFTFAQFAQVKGGSSTDLQTTEVRPYTEESQQARTAIDEAAAAIDEAESAGADVTGARKTLTNARDAFDGEEFNLATELASEAQDKAQGAQSSNQRTSYLLYAAGGIVVLLVVAGAVYYYLQSRETYDKLG